MTLVIGIIIGFLFSTLVAGKREGDKIERSLRFSVGKYFVHMHHWIWCSLLLIVLFVIGSSFYTVYGLLVGSIIQGLLYRDRFVIVYRKNINTKNHSAL